jgi:hypothetical protein
VDVKFNHFYLEGKMKTRFFLLVLLALGLILADCSKFSQRTEKPANQLNLVEQLNGIKAKANVEGFGILEYELYDVPGNESIAFQVFIRMYTKTLEEEYVFDQESEYWIEDNTVLSINVKTIMTNHNRNLSTTHFLNLDGSTTFVFNFLKSNGKYEFYSIDAYKKESSSSGD